MYPQQQAGYGEGLCYHLFSGTLSALIPCIPVCAHLCHMVFGRRQMPLLRSMAVGSWGGKGPNAGLYKAVLNTKAQGGV